VSKNADTGITETRIAALTENQRVNEVARMLGGLEITEKTLDHAREMLDTGI
jgi:DNA repair protein RecN (Recombination protein N)